MRSIRSESEIWLQTFAACVRARDYDGARALFDPAVCSFGTVASEVDSLDELIERQWQEVWPKTTGFDFVESSLRFVACGEDGVCLLAEWESDGETADGRAVPRTGRCSILLADRGSRLVCVHTHFSIRPGAGADCILA